VSDRADGNAITSAEQQKIDSFLDLEDVDVNSQVGVTPPYLLDRSGTICTTPDLPTCAGVSHHFASV
jgi:hypothetical protein